MSLLTYAILLFVIVAIAALEIMLLRLQRARLAESRFLGKTTSALRVLFVNRDLEFHGGVPRCLLHLARAHDTSRLAFHLSSFEGPSTIMHQAFEALQIKPVRLGSPGYLRPAWNIRKIIIRRGIDAVVATSFRSYLCCKLAALGLGKGNINVIFWMHAVEGTVQGPVRRSVLRLIGRRDPLLFVSHAIRNANLPGSHLGPSQVIYNGVEDHQTNTQFTLYDSFRRAEFAIPSDALVLANIGEFLPLKDHATVIRATHELTRRGINVHLILIGKGELSENLRRIAGVGPASENIHFLGAREDARRLLGLADIYVHGCSKEGFGLAVVEAMLAARPVVVARGGAVMEYVKDGQTGIVFNPGDAEDLAGAVMKLAGDSTRAVQIAEAGRALCLEKFDAGRWGNSIMSYIESVYPDAIARRRTNPAMPTNVVTAPVNADGSPELSCAS